MPFPAIVTLIWVFLTVAALAFFLISVAVALKKVNFTLGTVIAGVAAIAYQTEPIGPVLTEINSDLSGVQGALEGLLDKKTGGAWRN